MKRRQHVRSKETVKALELIQRLVSLNRRLGFQSRRLGLGYEAKAIVQGVDVGGPRVEESGTYTYPSTIELKIEGRSNRFVSVRIVDGVCIPEGRTLSGRGLTLAALYRRVLVELREHANELKRETQTFKPTGRRIVNAHCGAKLGGERQAFGCDAKPDPSNGFEEFSYTVDGYDSLVSTVSLCPRCVRNMKRQQGAAS